MKNNPTSFSNRWTFKYIPLYQELVALDRERDLQLLEITLRR